MRALRLWLPALFAFALATVVLGHGGGLDSNGGHYNRKTGEYHYHRAPRATQDTPALASPEGPAVSTRRLAAPVEKKPQPLVSDHDLTVAVQLLLAALGYDIGQADGDLGPQTADAIRAFQATAHLEVDGKVSGQLLIRVSTAVANRMGSTP